MSETFGEITVVPRDPTEVEWLRALTAVLESELGKLDKSDLTRELLAMRRPKYMVQAAKKSDHKTGD